MRRISLILSIAAALLLGLPSALAQSEPLADLGLPELAITLTDAGLEGVPAETPAGRYLVSFTNNVADTGDPFNEPGRSIRPASGRHDRRGRCHALRGPAQGEGDEGAGGTPVTEAGEAAAESSPEAGVDPFAFLYETYLAGGPGGPRGRRPRAWSTSSRAITWWRPSESAHRRR